jgi:hypothetical protein
MRSNYLRCLAGLSLAVGLGVCAVNSAHAGAISCPGTAVTTDREFTLTTAVASTCLTSGTGDINGNGDDINNFAPGYVTLDKSDDGLQYLGTLNELTVTGSGGTSGMWSFVAPSGFSDFVLALKSGEGQLDPDWAAFLLADGTTSGSWSISGSQSLSHMNLYGRVDPVPGPIVGAGFPGLLLASAFLAWRSRQRRALA